MNRIGSSLECRVTVSMTACRERAVGGHAAPRVARTFSRFLFLFLSTTKRFMKMGCAL